MYAKGGGLDSRATYREYSHTEMRLSGWFIKTTISQYAPPTSSGWRSWGTIAPVRATSEDEEGPAGVIDNQVCFMGVMGVI